MSLDVFDAGLQIAIPLSEIGRQDTLDKILGVGVKGRWKLWFACDDVFKEPARIFVVEWCESSKELHHGISA